MRWFWRQAVAGVSAGLLGLGGGVVWAEPDPALAALSRVSELLLITDTACPACPGQQALLQQVSQPLGFRVRVVTATELAAPSPNDVSAQLAARQRHEWQDKLPVLYVAVPQLPALLPIVSARSLPRTANELLGRLHLVADLAANRP
jgi:hypothetical protein